jgi:uncharacterized protein
MSLSKLPIPATALWTCVHTVAVLFLAGWLLRLRVGMRKFAPGINTKDGRLDPLFLAQRAHGNATEWLPFCLVTSLVAELCGAEASLLHVSHAILLVGRVLVSRGILTAGSRREGMTLTMTSLCLNVSLTLRALVTEATGSQATGNTAGMAACGGLVVALAAFMLAGNKPRPKAKPDADAAGAAAAAAAPADAADD